MNQRPQGLKVQKAITGFLHYKSAEGLAPVTVSGYERDLKLGIEYQGDVNVSQVQSARFLAISWLEGGDQRHFQKKSAPNDHLICHSEKTVSEDLRMMSPSFFTKETGSASCLDLIILNMGRHTSRT